VESAVLQAEGLAAIRGERLVFRDVGFAVAAGGALVRAGPNGAGKSTLLRLLAGLGRAAAGRVLWRGQDALEDRAEHALRVAYLGHQDAVKPGLSVAGNLAFAARGRAVACDPWIERWPLSVGGVVPDRRGRIWEISDRAGRRLPLTVDDPTGWKLLALSAGRPLHLVGEWDDDRTVALAVWADDRMVVL